jgi:hypothetical protein
VIAAYSEDQMKYKNILSGKSLTKAGGICISHCNLENWNPFIWNKIEFNNENSVLVFSYGKYCALKI